MVFRKIASLFEGDNAMRILLACSHGNRNNLINKWEALTVLCSVIKHLGSG